MLVNQSLSPDTIEIAESIPSAGDAISNMSEKLAGVLGVERDLIEQAVIERERVRTTAFANGAAIPHCRLPGLNRFGIGLLILDQSVRWADDGHDVDTVMMIVGPTANVSDHLRILANSSQLLDSSRLRAKLKAAPDTRSAYELMSAAEEFIEQRRSQVGMLREIRKDQESGSAADFLAEVTDRFDW